MVWRDGEGRETRFGVGFWAASGVALLAVVGIVVVLVVSSAEQDQPTAPASGSTAANEAELPQPEPDPEPAPTPAPTQEPDEVVDEPELVAVTLEGMPDDAKAFLDGKLVEPEFERPRSDTPYVLRVEAPGFEPFEKAVVLRRDLTVVVGMATKKIKFQLKDTNKGVKENKPVEEDSSEQNETLVSNPFGG